MKETIQKIFLENQERGVFVLAEFTNSGELKVLEFSTAKLIDIKKNKKWNLLCKDSCIRLIEDRFLFIKPFIFNSIERATSILYGKEYNFSNKDAKKLWKQKKESFLNNYNYKGSLVLINTKKKILAWGRHKRDISGFEILKNSIGTLNITSSGNTASYNKLFKQLKKDNTIEVIKSLKIYVFNKNYSFNSIEDATMFLEGSRKDSRRMKKWICLTNWKTNLKGDRISSKEKKIDFILEDSKNGIFAWGNKETNGFRVKKNSTSYFNDQYFEKNKDYKNMLMKLSKNKIVIIEGKKALKFKKNYIFKNIENATSFLLGYEISRSTASKIWINKNTGNSYLNIFLNQDKNNQDDLASFILNRFNKKINNSN